MKTSSRIDKEIIEIIKSYKDDYLHGKVQLKSLAEKYECSEMTVGLYIQQKIDSDSKETRVLDFAGKFEFGKITIEEIAIKLRYPVEYVKGILQNEINRVNIRNLALLQVSKVNESIITNKEPLTVGDWGTLTTKQQQKYY